MEGFGLLGETLSHSYSPEIHAALGDYEYRLYEKSPEELRDFLQNGIWQGLNVTIPYKTAVIPYCSELSEAARSIGSVNTLVRRADGSLFGDNTDAYGFSEMIRVSGISVCGKKVLVLGSGGASRTAVSVLAMLGASEVVVISRNGRDNYGNLARHKDAQIIVNTTPVGMYPKNGSAPIDLRFFPCCEGVLDIVYNPARTALLLAAEELQIPYAGGLYMLVAQAKRSSELFTGKLICDEFIGKIEAGLSCSMQNIVLIGMPGCGKSTVGTMLAELLKRPFFDADALIVKNAGISIPEIFERYGEERFRNYETEVLQELGKKSGAVIATGGGCVTRKENYPLLHQNSLIFWIRREISRLAQEGRPLSQKSSLGEMYRKRASLYAEFSDFAVENNGSILDTSSQIQKIFEDFFKKSDKC